ncbi:MAG: hypothetical protein GY805_14835 [Chloroflexi bacterium]|nr:hypothetical protein [Chloroflexota bacterium]
MSKRKYMAYLLRLWRENQDSSWRALLENPNTEERVGFANLNELIKFLENKTGEVISLSPAVNSRKEKINSKKRR